MVKQTVLIFGATGWTGSSIVDGLLQNGNFNVIAGVRPSSASKSEVGTLKARGVEIRIIDLQEATVNQLAEQLKGVDTVIVALFIDTLSRQKLIADACKIASVKRFIPNDWGTVCVRGVREMYDQKLEIHDYVKQIGIGYTFIDVGWWMESSFPLTESSKTKVPYGKVNSRFNTRYGTGNVKSAVTSRADIGKFVARIITDERTLNHYVFCWTQETTQNEAFALAERVSGQKFDIKIISAEEVAKGAKEAQDLYEKNVFQYMNSIYVRGDNTIANAKKEEYGGALDARELYPDIGRELRSLEEVAKYIYSP